MASKKSIDDLSELNKLDVFRETLSHQALLKRVNPVTKKGSNYSLEQKIIMIKILMLNDMRYDKTTKETGVTRKVLWSWWKKYGNMMSKINASEEVAVQLENNLAGLMTDIYKASRAVAKKAAELAEKANSVRDLRAVNDTLRAYAELIKVENQGKVGAGGEGQVNNFYTQINEMMVQNQFKNDGDKN